MITAYAETIEILKSIKVDQNKVAMLGIDQLPRDLRPRMERYFNKAHYVSSEYSVWDKAVLNPNHDFKALGEAFHRGEVVVLDDFLTQDALTALERIGHESQIWHATKQGNYVGAMNDDGFGPAPLAVLAHELEKAMPEVQCRTFRGLIRRCLMF